jgi:signal transduction histidine kinase
VDISGRAAVCTCKPFSLKDPGEKPKAQRGRRCGAAESTLARWPLSILAGYSAEPVRWNEGIELAKDSAAEIPGLPEHRPLPELASALRSQSEEILATWIAMLRQALPVVKDLSTVELRDNVPNILTRMADALQSSDANAASGLVQQSPNQGLSRFRQNYDIVALMSEDRLLRRVIIEKVELGLERRMDRDEQLALDTVIDVMLQQAVVAFVTKQQEQLRAATEAELKYLSFLSHDLNSNLSSLTMMLQSLKRRLETSPDFVNDVATLDAAQQAILNTIGGMGRLLQSERLRKAGLEAQRVPVNMHGLASSLMRQSTAEAERKGIAIVVDVAPDVVIASDAELIGLVLQNLISNAIKYAASGAVRIDAKLVQGRWAISVADQGPGIAAEHLARIFDAFRRGDAHGQPGVGLGLAIASQAAKLLGAELTVESKVGAGSTFMLIL